MYMYKHQLKKICIIATLVCMVVSITSVCSYAVDPLTFSAMSAAADAFGMSYGIGTTYSVTNAAGVDSSFQDLWDEFQTYQSNQGDSYNYQDYYDNFNDKDVVQSFTHSSGKFSGFVLDSEDVEIFTKFWDWLLSGPAEMQRVDDQYYEWTIDSQTGSVLPINVYSYSFLEFNGYSVPTFTSYYFIRDGYRFEYTFSSPVGIYATTNSHYYYFVAIFSNTNGVPNANLVVRNASNNSVVRTESNILSSTSSYGGTYRYKNLASAYDQELTFYVNTSVYPASYFDPETVFGAYNSDTISSGESTTTVEPYKENPITLPNPYAQDYIPEAQNIITNIPWDDSYDQQEDENGNPIPLPATDVPNIVNDWLESIQDNTYELEEAVNENPQPPVNEVYIPFLPVALPSFNFSFSGIWHYVREWVASLGSFFTTLFTIWSALPYAMVVPVYATAVVVIVLGVYKRFFM